MNKGLFRYIAVVSMAGLIFNPVIGDFHGMPSLRLPDPSPVSLCRQQAIPPESIFYVRDLLHRVPEKGWARRTASKMVVLPQEPLARIATRPYTLGWEPGVESFISERDQRMIHAVLGYEPHSIAELNYLSAQWHGRIYIAANEYYAESEGRTIYINLYDPFEWGGRLIHVLRLKGVRPRLTENGTVATYMWNPPWAVHANKRGQIIATPGEGDPSGGLLRENAEREIGMMRPEHSNVPTDCVIARGTFPAAIVQGRPLHFLIAGMAHEDTRLDYRHITYGYRSKTDKTIHPWTEEEVYFLFKRLGVLLARLHRGFVHRFLGLGNIGVEFIGEGFDLVFRDLDSGRLLNLRMTPQQRVAYRFLDVARILCDIAFRPSPASRDVAFQFLQGYFGVRASQPLLQRFLDTAYSEAWRKVLGDVLPSFNYIQPPYSIFPLARRDPIVGPIIRELRRNEFPTRDPAVAA